MKKAAHRTSAKAPGKPNSRLFRLLRGHRWLSTGLFLLCCVGIYLHVFGFPRRTIDWVLDHFRERGIVVTTPRITWNALEGIVAHDVEVYARAKAPVPVVEVDRLVLQFNPAAWFARKLGLEGVRIQEGSFRVSSRGGMAGLEKRQSSENITWRHIFARLEISTNGVDLLSGTADFNGMQLNVGGRFMAPDHPPSGSLIEAWESLFWTRKGPRVSPGWVSEMVRELNRIDFRNQGTAHLQFVLGVDRIEDNEVHLTAVGRDAACRGLSIRDWSMDAELVNGVLRIPSAVLSEGEGALQIDARMNFTNRILEAKVTSSLSPACWLSLMPDRWKQRSCRMLPDIKGLVEGELVVGPVEVSQAARHYGGWISVENLEARDTWVERARIMFMRQGELFQVDEFDMVLGRGNQRGTVTGQAVWSETNRVMDIRLSADCDPHVLVPFMTTNQARVIQHLQISDDLPDLACRVTVPTDDWRQYRAAGRVVASNVVYRGANMAFASIVFSVQHQHVLMDPIEIYRPEGDVHVTLGLDFERRNVMFEGFGTVHPLVVARCIGPTVTRIMTNFTFQGQTLFSATGRVDYAHRTNMQFDVDVDARKMGLRWVQTEQASLRFSGRGDHYRVDGLQADLYGGSVTGSVAWYPVEGDSNLHYEVSAVMSNLNAAPMLNDFRSKKKKEELKAHLSGRTAVRGAWGRGRGDTATGHGHVMVRGELFRFPVLGALSDLLSQIYPRLGFMDENDFSADFIIKDRKIITDNAVLEGDVLSMYGHGFMAFNKDLDFVVHVKFLRQSLVARLVNIVTYPITKLFLEFHLGGTPTEPDWRPQNLPKELYFKF